MAVGLGAKGLADFPSKYTKKNKATRRKGRGVAVGWIDDALADTRGGHRRRASPYPRQ